MEKIKKTKGLLVSKPTIFTIAIFFAAVYLQTKFASITNQPRMWNVHEHATSIAISTLSTETANSQRAIFMISQPCKNFFFVGWGFFRRRRSINVICFRSLERQTELTERTLNHNSWSSCAECQIMTWPFFGVFAFGASTSGTSFAGTRGIGLAHDEN